MCQPYIESATALSDITMVFKQMPFVPTVSKLIQIQCASLRNHQLLKAKTTVLIHCSIPYSAVSALLN